MALTVEVTSDRKGSNPGGECVVRNGVSPFDGYFKYCTGSKLSRHSPFTVGHQPVYEAFTFGLARKLGLKTTDHYLLLNRQKNVEFRDPEHHSRRDHSGKDFYFLSRFVPNPIHMTNHRDDELEKHRPYLESMFVSDVIGSKQNYTYGEADVADQEVTYLDLGCSFVHAHEGFLAHPHKLKYRRSKDVKRAVKRLGGKALISADGTDLIDLEEFVFLPYDMKLPTMNPPGAVNVNLIFSQYEADEIHAHLVQGVSETLPLFKERNLLL
jgi:hypothetical protein